MPTIDDFPISPDLDTALGKPAPLVFPWTSGQPDDLRFSQVLDKARAVAEGKARFSSEEMHTAIARLLLGFGRA